MTLEGAQAFVAEVARRAHQVADPEDVPQVSRHPDDDCLLALAGVTGSRAVVSGDLDMTELEGPSIPVMPPGEAVEALL